MTRPNWGFNTPASREQLRLYCLSLLAGLKGAGRRPTNLAKVRAIVQRTDETPIGFLKRLQEGYRMYTLFDPTAADHKGHCSDVFHRLVSTAHPWQAAEVGGTTGIPQDLVKKAEKVFNKRETPEEKEESLRREQEDREDTRDKKRCHELRSWPQ